MEAGSAAPAAYDPSNDSADAVDESGESKTGNGPEGRSFKKEASLVSGFVLKVDGHRVGNFVPVPLAVMFPCRVEMPAFAARINEGRLLKASKSLNMYLEQSRFRKSCSIARR